MTEKRKTGGKRGRGQGVLRKDGKPRESNTGTRKPVVDDSNWRVKAKGKHRIKFDDVAKKRYLEKLAETGRKWSAEQAAGVARSTVEAHLENDPEFADAFEDAIAAYSTPKIIQIEKEAIEGHLDQHYHDGQLVRERRVYETRLREKFLERYEPEYHPKHKVEHSGEIGGAFVIPGVAALSDWEASVKKHDVASAKSQDPDAAEIHVGDTSTCEPPQ
jgi:hypothetical protein